MRAPSAPASHSARKERRYHQADDAIVLFHLLPSIFAPTGKLPSCEAQQSLVSNTVPVSEVPLAAWRWEMLQWVSPHTRNSRAMPPSNSSRLQKTLSEWVRVTLGCYFQTCTSCWLLLVYFPALFIYLLAFC